MGEVAVRTAVQEQFALRRLQEAQNEGEQGRLAEPRRADDRGVPAPGDGQVDAPYGGLGVGAVGRGDLPQRQYGHVVPVIRVRCGGCRGRRTGVGALGLQVVGLTDAFRGCYAGL